MGTEHVVDIAQLTKRYGPRLAVGGVDLQVRRGEILGLIGRNGAGKTTLVECALGLRRPDSGTVQLLGHDPLTARSQLRGRVGVQLQHADLPDRMRVGEAVKLFASRNPSPSAVSSWGLHEIWRAPFGTLSGGERQRVLVALALVDDPEVVFLDELTQGLDPTARRSVWQLVAGIRSRGATVVLVTHFADDAEAMCDRVAVMCEGAVVEQGTPAELIDRHGGGVTMTFTDPGADVAQLRGLGGVLGVGVSGDQIEVVGRRVMVAHVGAHLVRQAVDARHPVPEDICVREPTLDDALVAVLSEPGASASRPWGEANRVAA
jgi:ABC-2 type transport system ATP-binding protein